MLKNFSLIPCFLFSLSANADSWRVQDTMSLFGECETTKIHESYVNTNKSFKDVARFALRLYDDETVDFVCKVNKYADDINNETREDRKFMKEYLQRKNKGRSLSKENHIHMTLLLIKYRLLRHPKTRGIMITDSSGSKHPLYVSTSRYDWPNEVKNRMRKSAEAYVESFGPPSSCYYSAIKNNKYSANIKGELLSDACVDAIDSKTMYNPKSLVIAQAVVESGSGTSLWATKYNNVLGLQILFNNPSSMKRYQNCLPAEQDKSRCILLFPSQRSSVYEYMYRFNASPLEGYKKYRDHRRDVCQKISKQTGEEDCGKAMASMKSEYCGVKNSSATADICSAGGECSLSLGLTNFMEHYAENENYLKEVTRVLSQVCNITPYCAALY